MVLDSTQLATFAAVVADGSFEAAARSLRVTPSAVSQRIKALEQTVGQVLVRRAKPCLATPAGKSLLRLAGQLSLLEREALDAARGAPVSGAPVSGAPASHGRTRVSVVVNADSLATWFLSAVAALPDDLAIAFDLCEDDQDHTADLLRDGSVMAAVTAQDVPVQGCRVERLGAMRYRAVAAPSLVARWFPDGATNSALGVAPMIVFNRKDQLQHRFLQALTGGRVDPPVHYVPSVWGFGEAIRMGLGWGMVPEQIARDDIESQRCVDIAPGRYLDVPLYWQHWQLDSTILNALTAAVTAAAATVLR